MKKNLRLYAGWGLLVLGVAGLFLPVLQGVLFIIGGLLLLAPRYRWARRPLAALQRRYPRLFKKALDRFAPPGGH